jgi:DNA replication protein DnaC
METNLLLKAYLKRLRLPTMRRDLEKALAEATQASLPYERFLLGLVEQEIFSREENTLRSRLARAKFPLVKTLESFEFSQIPSLDKQTVLQLAEGDFIREAKNCVCIGNSGTGKTHVATAIGVAACRAGFKVRFITAAGLVNELLEARKDSRLARFQNSLMRFDLVILDELGYIPFDTTGAQLLFNFCAERYERRSLFITTNLDFGGWTSVFGDESLTGALLDRLTHHCHILLMNGESYRFRESQKEKTRKGVKNDNATRKAQKNQGE